MYASLTLTRDHAHLKRQYVGSIMQLSGTVFSLVMEDVVAILTTFYQKKNVTKFVNQVRNTIFMYSNYINIRALSI
jgi:hypothetical protein